MADSFIKEINDSDVGQLLGLAANFSGTIQGVAAFISLFQQSDSDKILSAISQLRQDIERDFKQLGDLITQQTQIVVDTVNRDAMALALSRSDIASGRIQEFLTSNNNNALEAAKTESIGGVRFFYRTRYNRAGSAVLSTRFGQGGNYSDFRDRLGTVGLTRTARCRRR